MMRRPFTRTRGSGPVRAGLLCAVLSAALIAVSTAPAHAADEVEFEHYVALGDSYTAGPLIPAQLPGPLGCFRSSANYPAFLATYFRVRTFTDVSCSAARTEHLFESQTGILPGSLPENTNAPQLLALTPETDLVTLGIGGNDFGLFGEMIDQCADLAAERPDAYAPCREHFTVRGVDTKLRDARAIQGNVDQALAAIKKRAPRATVVVVNYLHILPETGTCANVPFAAGDYRWGTRVHQALNTSLRKAARKHRAEYVDMYAASVGHDACAAPREQWVNGATIRPRAFNYHPFRSGMAAIARTTYTQLTGEAAPLGLPVLSAIKRLPAVVDVDGLLSYAANGGTVPPQVLDQAESQGTTIELVRPVLEDNVVVEQVKATLTTVEALLAAVGDIVATLPGAPLDGPIGSGR